MIGYLIAMGIAGAAGFVLGRDASATDAELLGKIRDKLAEHNIGPRRWANTAHVEHRRLERYLDGEEDALDEAERQALVIAAQRLIADPRARVDDERYTVVVLDEGDEAEGTESEET